jgi:plasmid stabilization system protein ParE
MLSHSLFTPQAWQDTLEIIEYIGTDNSDAAARFLPALEKTCAQLAALPGMGSVRIFQRKDLRAWRCWG